MPKYDFDFGETSKAKKEKNFRFFYGVSSRNASKIASVTPEATFLSRKEAFESKNFFSSQQSCKATGF